MALGNITVSTLVNRVEWEIDKNSYDRALKRIKKLKEENEAPQKRLEQAQKKTAQVEGKAALASAKAQTQKLKQAQRLSLEQQKQAQTASKIAQQEQSHARKMHVLNAKGTADRKIQEEQLARQKFRLNRINQKILTGQAGRSTLLNPGTGRVGNAGPNVLSAAAAEAARQRTGAIISNMSSARRDIADAERKEAALKREVLAYNQMRRSALLIANISGVEAGNRFKAVQAAKKVIQQEKEGKITAEQRRFELQRITSELRKQATLGRRLNRQSRGPGGAGGANVNGGAADAGMNPAIIAGAAVAAATLALPPGVDRVGEILSSSQERSQNVKELKQYNISALEFAAIQDVVKQKSGFDLTADKLLDMSKDFREKSGELLNTGSFRKNAKTGAVTFSGGGEFADIINGVLSATNGDQKSAEIVIQQLQKMNFPEFLMYLKQLQKEAKWSDRQVAHLAEALNDGSRLLAAFNDQGADVINRMNLLASEGWALSEAQKASLERLSALSGEYSRMQESLEDHFSTSFIQGLGEYATNTDSLRNSMTGLIPITEALGQAIGDATAILVGFIGRAGERLKRGGTLPDALYGQVVDDGANATAKWIEDKTGFNPQAIGQFFTGIGQGLRNRISNIGNPQTGGQVSGLENSVWNPTNNGLNDGLYHLATPTFTTPSLNSSLRQGLPLNITSEPLNVNNRVDVYVHDDKVQGLIDATVQDSERQQLNLLIGGGVH